MHLEKLFNNYSFKISFNCNIITIKRRINKI